MIPDQKTLLKFISVTKLSRTLRRLSLIKKKIAKVRENKNIIIILGKKMLKKLPAGRQKNKIIKINMVGVK